MKLFFLYHLEMTIRRMTMLDIPQVLDLIERSPNSHLIRTTAEALHSGSVEFEQVFPDFQWKRYVWERNGLQGTFVLHWNTEHFLLQGVRDLCVLYETFWDPGQTELQARKVMLDGALHLLQQAGLKHLVVLNSSLNGAPQMYLDLGGTWGQLNDPEGTDLGQHIVFRPD